MFDKMKDLSAQVVSRAGDAVGDITTTVKGGIESLANTAGTMTEAVNERAVRASTAQVCSILEVAIEELKSRPLANQRVTLTASVNIGIAALEMQVHVEPVNASVITSISTSTRHEDSPAEGR
jgi:hypothetical protein